MLVSGFKSESVAAKHRKTVEQQTDDVLVASTKSGDELAFEELFERYRRHVAFIASRFFAHREQIEEIIQDTFTKAYFALDSYHGTHEKSFKAWLTQIAVNSSYDQLRRARRRPEHALNDLNDNEQPEISAQLHAGARDIESTVVSRDLAVKLLARLSAEDRVVLTLLDVEGFSVAEIAEMTRWSVSKVKVRAHRARAHLRRILRKYI
jgi:RNA polymerase sigma-70 factor (ECF subfamily)